MGLESLFSKIVEFFTSFFSEGGILSLLTGLLGSIFPSS